MKDGSEIVHMLPKALRVIGWEWCLVGIGVGIYMGFISPLELPGVPKVIVALLLTFFLCTIGVLLIAVSHIWCDLSEMSGGRPFHNNRLSER